MVDGWQPGTLLCLAWDLTYWDGTAAALWGGPHRERESEVPTSTPQPKPKPAQQACASGGRELIWAVCTERASEHGAIHPSHPSIHRSSVRRRDIRSVSFTPPRLLAALVFTYPCSLSSRVLVARA